MTTPTYDQDSFRGRNDNGSQTTATWKAAANANWTQNVDENFRIRFLVQNTNNRLGSAQTWRLQYNKGGAGWNDVTASSSVVKAVDSANLTDGADTTQQVGAGSFVADNNGV